MAAVRDRGEIFEDDCRWRAGISRTVADADGYAWISRRTRRRERKHIREGEEGKQLSEDLMLTGIKINGQSCTLTCHLIPPCVILIDQ